MDVTLGGAREQLESIVGHGEDRDFAQAPFTPRSKKVLALRESMQLEHNYIGTEHIPLGLVREQVIQLLGSEPSGRTALGGPRGIGSCSGHRLAFEGQMRYGTVGEAVVPQTPQTVSVELDYAYTAQKTGEALLGTVDPSDLREGVACVLAGEGALKEFPMVWEITVSVPRAQDPGRSPGTRLSRTAGR